MSSYNLSELAHTLFQESGDALFLFDADSERMLEVNSMAQHLSGFSREELLQLPAPNLFRSDDSEGFSRLVRAYRQAVRFHSQEGFWLRRREAGSWVPVNLTVTRLRTAHGVVGLITARDISERRRHEEALRTSEANCRSLLENLEQSIFLIHTPSEVVPSLWRQVSNLPKETPASWKLAHGRTGKLETCRHRIGQHLRGHVSRTPVCVSSPPIGVFAKLSACPKRDVLGKTDFDFYPSELAEKYRADDRRVLSEGRRLELEEKNLFQGQLRRVRVIKTPVRDPQERISGVLGIFWDVTEQHALEEQLRQAQKMEIASGYSAEYLSVEDHEHICGFVNKPYRPDDLALAVRTALDRRRCPKLLASGGC